MLWILESIIKAVSMLWLSASSSVDVMVFEVSHCRRHEVLVELRAPLRAIYALLLGLCVFMTPKKVLKTLNLIKIMVLWV